MDRKSEGRILRSRRLLHYAADGRWWNSIYGEALTTTKTPEQEATVIALTHKLTSLGLSASFVDPISVGPIVSVYRFQPIGSTKVSHLEGLSQDFAVALGAEDILCKRMPGEASVGVFVPNKQRQYVKWFNYCTVDPTKYKLPLVLGVDYLGKLVVEDLSLMPHLLIAGQTGGGKSTLLNSIIGTLILNYSPKDVELVLCDIKEGVEFTKFQKAPHLRSNIATSLDLTHIRFDELIDEMTRRLKLFAQTQVHNILEYNSTRQGSQARLPYVALIIDEIADLLTDRRKIEEDEPSPDGKPRYALAGKIASGKLSKLAAKARASGIHIIVATQRPSAKLLEGDIKSNFPARLTFKLPSQTDSRVVLDTGGAEHLLNRGDMLLTSPNRPGLQRIHAPLSTAADIESAIEYALQRR
jgi:S-DNA-T family DNA segregation ATPase FtsK/SpoIIIE